MSKWEKPYLNSNLTRRMLHCAEYRVDDAHNVMVLARDNRTYDCYVLEHDETAETPFLYMFGLSTRDMDYRRIVETAIRSAPDYYNLFEED